MILIILYFDKEPTEYLSLGDKISYNETIGFTLHNINSRDAKTYACGVRPNGDQLAVNVTVKGNQLYGYFVGYFI